jgi:hypothetical protein
MNVRLCVAGRSFLAAVRRGGTQITLKYMPKKRADYSRPLCLICEINS